LPSFYPEGLPKSLLEAAASGVPLVTTDVPGCRELVPDGETGLLVPPRDPGALAEALERLADDPATRRSMGTAARRMAERRFSDRAVGAAIVRLYEHVLAS
jgi:glycosyltransferase involved in cell wall biosynthesis